MIKKAVKTAFPSGSQGAVASTRQMEPNRGVGTTAAWYWVATAICVYEFSSETDGEGMYIPSTR